VSYNWQIKTKSSAAQVTQNKISAANKMIDQLGSLWRKLNIVCIH
jgi:hypothetical protein